MQGKSIGCKAKVCVSGLGTKMDQTVATPRHAATKVIAEDSQGGSNCDRFGVFFCGAENLKKIAIAAAVTIKSAAAIWITKVVILTSVCTRC